MLAGNLAAIGVGGIVSVVWSYIVSKIELYCVNGKQALYDCCGKASR